VPRTPLLYEEVDLEFHEPYLFSKLLNPHDQYASGNLIPLHFTAMDGHAEIVYLLLKWNGIPVAPLDTKKLSPVVV
jgi:hypothetical protein